MDVRAGVRAQLQFQYFCGALNQFCECRVMHKSLVQCCDSFNGVGEINDAAGGWIQDAEACVAGVVDLLFGVGGKGVGNVGNETDHLAVAKGGAAITGVEGVIRITVQTTDRRYSRGDV